MGGSKAMTTQGAPGQPLEIEVRRADLDSTAATTLIQALNEELTALYRDQGPGVNHFRLEAEEVSPGRGAFLVAFSGETPVGCGAIRRLDAGVAEIKRMYVDPAARGRGVAGRVLAQLEAEARLLGVRRIVLETGPRQLAAIALYTRAGFSPIPAFGEYEGGASSNLCLAKELR
jgi:putative acetyltransferase